MKKKRKSRLIILNNKLNVGHKNLILIKKLIKTLKKKLNQIKKKSKNLLIKNRLFKFNSISRKKIKKQEEPSN
jgi:hypothetical protein